MKHYLFEQKLLVPMETDELLTVMQTVGKRNKDGRSFGDQFGDVVLVGVTDEELETQWVCWPLSSEHVSVKRVACVSKLCKKVLILLDRVCVGHDGVQILVATVGVVSV